MKIKNILICLLAAAVCLFAAPWAQAATYNTENYTNNLYPDSGTPAGVLLCNTAEYIASATTVAASTINLMTIPKGARIVDCMVYCTDGASGATLDIGLKYKNACTDSGGTARTAGEVIDADGLWTVLPIGTGPVTASFYGGVVGNTSHISVDTHDGALKRNYKALADLILYGTVATAEIESGDILTVTVLYYMDYGQDLTTTQP
jgi:hypothetical protein